MLSSADKLQTSFWASSFEWQVRLYNCTAKEHPFYFPYSCFPWIHPCRLACREQTLALLLFSVGWWIHFNLPSLALTSGRGAGSQDISLIAYPERSIIHKPSSNTHTHTLLNHFHFASPKQNDQDDFFLFRTVVGGEKKSLKYPCLIQITLRITDMINGLNETCITREKCLR